MTDLLHSEITGTVLECFFKVYNSLGYGFLEKVYERALIIELRQAGLQCSVQYPIKVYYEGEVVGDYFADIMVERKVIVELKAADALCEEHEFQLVNYLKATDIEVGLLLNFGKKPQFKRKAFSNNRN